MTVPFWQAKSLAEMTREEWESLCDGCAKCCLHKLEDEDSGEVFYTRVACRYLDHSACRCTQYARRTQLVPNCVNLQPGDIAAFHWLPDTCAYRLIAAGQPLPSWHHLLCGSPEGVHRAAVSVRGRVLSEQYVHPDGMKEHIVHWVE